MKKETMWLLILLLGGLYVLGFGIFTLVYHRMLANGITLVCFGTFVSSFSMIVFVDYKIKNYNRP